MLVRDTLNRRDNDQNKLMLKIRENLNTCPTGEDASSHCNPAFLYGGHLVSRTAAATAAVVVVVMTTWWHHTTLYPIRGLGGGVSVSRCAVGGARRGQGGRAGGGRAVRRRQLGQALRSRTPLCKTCIVLKEEYRSTMYRPVVHLVSVNT